MSASVDTARWRAQILQDRCVGLASGVRREADSKDAAAEVVYALMYDRGCGVTQNMVVAEKRFEAAIADGSNDPVAIGYVALYGTGGSTGSDKGVAMLSDAAKSGDPFAATMLAWYFSRRHLEAGDEVAAVHWSEVGSRAGDMRANADLGYDYLYAIGTSRDVARGKQLIESSAAANDPSGISALGVAYIDGVGVNKNVKKGISLIQQAIASGSTLANTRLVAALLSNNFAQKSAYRSSLVPLATEAAQMLYPRPIYDTILGWVDVIGGTTAAERERGFALSMANVNLTSYIPDRVVGYCYLYGIGVTQDVDKAVSFLKSAEAKGSPDAVDALKVIAVLRESAEANAAAAGSYDQRQNYWRSQQIPGMQTPDMRPAIGMPLPGSAAYPQSY